MLERFWRKGNPSALFVGIQTGAATVENSMELSENIKNGTASSDSTSEVEYIQMNLKYYSKEHKHPHVHCSVIYNCQDMEETQVSISR